MNYLSPEFAGAFIVFFALYWSLRLWPTLQKGVLLLASYAFYVALDLRFALILLFFSLWVLGLAEFIRRPDGSRRNWIAGLAMGGAAINLLVFKYFNFFRESLQAALHQLGLLWTLPALDILLPVGISFYTFQGIAYLVSIAKGERDPAHPLDGLLYLAFFPTLLAGPICRPQQLLTPLESKQPRQIESVDLACWLIVLAIAKKVWLASWLANSWVTPVFANPEAFHPLERLAGIYAYALQIYFDFSGYTDIVTAVALLLGYRLPANFDQPYRASSLKEFWQRWHISLSSWIRDFIYIPLGGNRGGWWRGQCNAFVAMLVSGLWHGASVTYIVWGAWHGFGLFVQNAWKRFVNIPLPTWLGGLITFHVVCLGWLFFRADDWATAKAFFAHDGRLFHHPHGNLLGLLLSVGIYLWVAPLLPKATATLLKGLGLIPWWIKPLILVPAVLLLLHVAPAGMPGFIYFSF